MKIRYYTTYECMRLSTEARGMLQDLEQNGAINAELRERIIEHALTLKIDQIEIEHIAWVILVKLLESEHGNKEIIQRALFYTQYQAEHGSRVH